MSRRPKVYSKNSIKDDKNTNIRIGEVEDNGNIINEQVGTGQSKKIGKINKNRS